MDAREHRVDNANVFSSPLGPYHWLHPKGVKYYLKVINSDRLFHAGLMNSAVPNASPPASSDRVHI
jgi:hypothetical protein